MNVVFRTEGNSKTGLGHVMRCITLAEELIQNASVTFILSDKSKDTKDIVESAIASAKVVILPFSKHEYVHEHVFSDEHANEDAINTKQVIDEIGQVDWLIVDHYGIDKKWEAQFRDIVNKIMVIDDLANREHECDLLLDQNYYTDSKTRYINLVPNDCRCLLGVQYSLLRKEFSQNQKVIVKDDVENILISFGGTDWDNMISNVLDVLQEGCYKDIKVNVVMGNASRYKESVKDRCEQYDNFFYHQQINYMAKLMSQADIFIGAGGSTSWERLAMGLPSIVIAIADNQVKICEDLAKIKLVSYFGQSKEYSNDKFKKILDSVIADKQWRQFVSGEGTKLVDGVGARKVAEYIIAEVLR